MVGHGVNGTYNGSIWMDGWTEEAQDEGCHCWFLVVVYCYVHRHDDGMKRSVAVSCFSTD